MKNSNDKPELNSLDAENLLALSRSGDELAGAVLLSKMIPFVMSRALIYINNEMDIEDLAQEGMIGLISAIHNYNFDSDIPFRIFAKICIDRKIFSALKSSLRQKHMPLKNYISFNAGDEVIEVAGGTSVFSKSPEEMFIEEEEAELIRSRMKESLSEFELEVFEAYLSGCSYEEISRKLSSNTKAVDNAMQRVRRKMKTAKDDS